MTARRERQKLKRIGIWFSCQGCGEDFSIGLAHNNRLEKLLCIANYVKSSYSVVVHQEFGWCSVMCGKCTAAGIHLLPPESWGGQNAHKEEHCCESEGCLSGGLDHDNPLAFNTLRNIL